MSFSVNFLRKFESEISVFECFTLVNLEVDMSHEKIKLEVKRVIWRIVPVN